jgi:endoglucanase
VRKIVDAAASAGATPVLLVYQLPNRDAGAGYSAGGLADATTYRNFTAAVAAGIGGRSAVIILEPDGLAQMNALSVDEQNERYALLNEAVDAYGRLGHTAVYLDAAHCAWTPASVMAQRLQRAGVSRARGFAVNVANFQPTAAEVARGRQIAQLTGGTHFVVDTGRNGNGPYRAAMSEAWCNPPGRALGATPTLTAGDPALDALLWIKNPGSSDGNCGRGNPPAGTFWPDYAVDLANNAGWS